MLNVAIIGAGGAGSAAARFLARAGHAVTVYERFTLDHDQGSSYGGSRIIRRTYPDRLYTRMMGLAYDHWAELERESGEELFLRCGGLTFGTPDNPDMARTEDALRANGVPYERLSAADVARRFPAFRLEPEQSAIYQADSGLLRASRCVRAQMRLAVASGAALRENVRARAVDAAPNGALRVTTEGGMATHDRVLFTAGPWMAELLPDLSLPLTVTRQYYAHLLPAGHAEQFEVGAFPVWIDADTWLYGFPHHDALAGVKLAQHEGGLPSDPDQVRRDVDESDRRPLRAYAARRLPALTGPIAYEKTCLYTKTPDEDFIIDAVPGLPGAFLCSGCSGHGFKFTVLLGQILSALAQSREPPCDLTRFRLARFSG